MCVEKYARFVNIYQNSARVPKSIVPRIGTINFVSTCQQQPAKFSFSSVQENHPIPEITSFSFLCFMFLKRGYCACQLFFAIVAFCRWSTSSTSASSSLLTLSSVSLCSSQNSTGRLSSPMFPVLLLVWQQNFLYRCSLFVVICVLLQTAEDLYLSVFCILCLNFVILVLSSTQTPQAGRFQGLVLSRTVFDLVTKFPLSSLIVCCDLCVSPDR